MTGVEETADEARREQRMRRRFARRAWARRWSWWKPVLAAVVLAAVVGLGVWTVWFSELLAVDEVTVAGTSYLTEEQVLEAAAVETGRPLARLDPDAVERRIAALAPVLTVEVRRELPGTVAIDVTEREAVAVLRIGRRLAGLDADGVVFRDFRRAPKGLPRVRDLADGDADSLREAASVVTSLPEDLVSQVRRVDVASVDMITLRLAGERSVVWGSGESSAEKAAVLAALLQASDAKSYDVSVPGQPSHTD